MHTLAVYLCPVFSVPFFSVPNYALVFFCFCVFCFDFPPACRWTRGRTYCGGRVGIKYGLP